MIKSAFDPTTTALLVIFLLPAFAAIAVTIKAGNGGPVLVRQTCVGKDGKAFQVYNFRTMVVDAE